MSEDLHDPETGEITTAEFRHDEPIFPLPVLNKMDTLFGDLRDAVLDRLKAMPKPWSVMSEREQIDMITGVEQVARHLVNQACRIISANGHENMTCIRTGMKVTDEDVVIQVKAPVHLAAVHALIDYKGPLMLVLASPEGYFGEKAPAKPDPDEPALPLNDGKAEESGEVVSIRRGRGRPRKDGAPAHPQKTSDSALLPPIPTSAMPHIHKAKSLEELLTVRFPNGATMAMIINEGLRSSEVSDYMAQGKIALIDDCYIWEDIQSVDRSSVHPIEDPPEE